MKKLFYLLIILLFSNATMVAQTIVGTDPENRNVVLEEFTGIHCVYCPDGHAIAQGIYDAHPDDVVLINIHQGSFAVPSGSEPDFRTQWGDAIAGQSGLLGYPAGTVNRHLFPRLFTRYRNCPEQRNLECNFQPDPESTQLFKY